jgi:hypothetical protein
MESEALANQTVRNRSPYSSGKYHIPYRSVLRQRPQLATRSTCKLDQQYCELQDVQKRGYYGTLTESSPSHCPQECRSSHSRCTTLPYPRTKYLDPTKFELVDHAHIQFYFLEKASEVKVDTCKVARSQCLLNASATTFWVPFTYLISGIKRIISVSRLTCCRASIREFDIRVIRLHLDSLTSITHPKPLLFRCRYKLVSVRRTIIASSSTQLYSTTPY